MTDKLRSTFPIAVTFGPGEQPTSTSLNILSNQTKVAFGLMEKAIGDLWGKSGDVTMDESPPQVANIARVLGRQYLGNSHFAKPDLDSGDIVRVVQNIVAQHGQTEIALDFIPVAAGGSMLYSSLADAGFDTVAGSRPGVDAANQFYVDTANAKVILGAPWPTTGGFDRIIYDVLDSNLPADNGSGGGFNVIPDPRASNFEWHGLKFYKVPATTNTYLLYLPPRTPTTLAGQGHLPDSVGNRISIDVNGAATADVVGLKYYFTTQTGWAALDAAEKLSLSTMHEYRYTLPSEIAARMLDSGSSGEQLPGGMLYLWDNDLDSIVDGVTFRVPEVSADPYPLATFSVRPRWVMQIQGATLDALLADYHTTASDVSGAEGLPTSGGDYKKRFSLVTVGESVAKSLDTLRTEALTHTHAAGMGDRVKHANLLLLSPSSAEALFGTQKLAGTQYAGDDHPLYLARTGTGVGSDRDLYRNGMMGNLFLMSTNSNADYQNLTADSHKIVFGTVSGPSIGYESTTTSLNLIGNPLVTIGQGAATTHLRLSNNKLEFGAVDDHLLFNGTVTYDLVANSSYLNSILRLGTLQATHIDVATLTTTGNVIIGNAGDSLTVNGTIDATGDITTGSDVQADRYLLNATKDIFINLPLVPAWHTEALGVWQQLSSAGSWAGAKPAFNWLEVGVFDETEIFWFAIPWLPSGGSVVGARLTGTFDNSGGGTSTSFYFGLGNDSGYIGGSSVLTSALGAGGFISIPGTFASPQTVNDGSMFFVLGLKNTNVGGSSGELGINRITIECEYNEIDL